MIIVYIRVGLFLCARVLPDRFFFRSFFFAMTLVILAEKLSFFLSFL